MAEKSLGSDAPPVFSNLPCAFQYSPSLNCIVALSNQSGIEVLDIHSCSITTRVPIPNSVKGYLGCNYLEDEDKLILSCGSKLGCRSTSGEQIFLKTILHSAEIANDGEVTIELDIVKAGLLLNNFEKCTQAASRNSQKALFKGVTTKLKTCYEKAARQMKDMASPEIKWMTVCLTMKYEVLMKAFNCALLMGKQEQRGPALPVVGDVLQQLTAMQKTTHESISSEKRLMFNEVDRLQTFNSWPHMNYKWALPGPMAEAGFYHPHNTQMSVEDRAMCFTCSVCLVSWESSDQPWSEHIRHSRNCPYASGEYTENVPLQVYTASARPQELQRPTDKIVCMSSGANNLIATGTEEGFIVIWSLYPTLKVHSEYQISVSAITKERKKKSTKDKAKDTPVTSSKITATDTIARTAGEIVQIVETEGTSKDDIKQVESSRLDVESYLIIEEVSSAKTSEVDNITPEPRVVITVDKFGEKNEEPANAAKPSDNSNDKRISDIKTESKTRATTVEESEDSKSTTAGFERKCNITSVAILHDENCASTYVVAGVRIESRKSRKTKVKTKTKLSLLVYKLAGKVSTNSATGKENKNKPHVNPYLPINYDFTLDPEDSESYLGSDPYVDPYIDPSQLSVIDEYLMAAHKNPLVNGGTQNISLMNEVKSGFDQEEIVQIDDIKTVYEDCVFHKFDIDKTYYNKEMVISDLLVVDNYLVVILKKEKNDGTVDTTIESSVTPTKNVILVFSIKSNPQQVTELKLVNSRTLTNTIIHDSVKVLYKNLPPYILSSLIALEKFELGGENEEDESKEKADSKMLLLTALSDNTLSFLTVPKLAEQKLVTSLDNDRRIHKIAYCNPLLSVAICDNKGYLNMQPCVIRSDKSQDASECPIEVPEAFKDELASGLKLDRLKVLTEMTKFEPVTQGCYVFFPMNWYFSRAGSSKSLITKPTLKHMFHLSPLEMDRRLVKHSEKQDDNSRSDFTFHMFVMAKTTIGYLDVLVNLKSQLISDFQCCVYVDQNIGGVHRVGKDDEMSNGSDEGTLLYGPVLFSSIMSASKSSGYFTIMVPEMICKKSLSVIIKLKPVSLSRHEQLDSSSNSPSNSPRAERSLPVPKRSLSEPNNWSFIIKDIYVGVHQFKRVPENFPGCQSLFAKDEVVQLHLVNRLLSLLEQNGDLREGFEIKLIMRLLLWIASIHCHAVEKNRLPLVSILLERIPEFLKATLFYGDRSLCHSCCQLLIALKSATTNDQFKKNVLKEVWKLIPHVHNAASSAAVHWMFVLLLDFLKGGEIDGSVLQKFTTILYDVGKVYGNEINETQRILDARYGLADPIFQPVLKDPMFLRMKSGNTTKKGFVRVLETAQVSADHLPGILEVQPLHFTCVSVSEGAKAEQWKQKSSETPKTSKQLNNQVATPFPIFQDTVVPSMLNTIIENVESTESKPVDYVSIAMSMWDDNAKEELPYYDLPLFGASNIGALGEMTGPTTSTTMMPSKATTINKVNTSSHQEVEITQEESVIPLPCCLLVDKMHNYSVHYAIVDFKSQVYLTDLIIMPCRTLASITISTWHEEATPDDEIILASSDEINQNALVLSNLVSPVELRYIKIVVVGNDSCSAIIPLGQYFGYQKSTSISATHIEKLQKQFGDVFCRYALAADRIIAPPVEKLSSSKIILNNLKKNYNLCSHLQLCLNFLNNNLTWCSLRNLLQRRDLQKDLTSVSTTPLSEKSFSDQQLVLTTLLKTILFYFDTMKSTTGSDESGVNSVLSKGDFLLLFKKICVYGIGNIQELATCVLYRLCGNCPWWEDVVIEVFQMCFAVNPTVPIPKRRLFNVLMKLMQCSKGLIVEKLLHLLQQHIKSLLSPSNADVITNPMSLDWILLAVTQILDRKDISMWNFFSPWSSLFNNEEQCSRHETPVEDGEAVEITGDLFLSKSTCIPVLSSLMDFILSKLEHGNADQSILACKVCSLILIRCQGLVHIKDFLGEPSLKRMLSACLNTSHERKWLTHSINLLLQTIVTQKDLILKEIGLLPSVSSSVNSFTKAGSQNDKVNHLPPFGDKDGAISGTSKLMNDQLHKKFEKLKAKQESMNKKFFDATEGKYFPGEKGPIFGDTGPIEKEDVLSSTAIQCDVIHPQSTGFHRILEADILSQQNSTWCRKYELSNESNRLQKLWIPSNIEYGIEVMAMKSSTLSSIVDSLLELIIEKDDDVDLQCLQQLQSFLKILPEQKIDINENTAIKLCNTCLNILKTSTIVNTNPSYKSVIKKITKILLGIPAVASTFSLQLLHVSLTANESESKAQSGDFSELHMMSLQRLVSMAVLQNQERILLKELISKISCIRDSRNSKLITVLNQVLIRGTFLRLDGEKEVSVTSKLLLSFSRQTLEFVKDFSQILYAAHQDRADTKRTIFLLQNGKCRLSGKSHMTFSDMNLALLFVASIDEIVNAKVPIHHSQSDCIEEVFSNLFQTLSCFGRLSIVYKANVLNHPGPAPVITLPIKMVAFQSASNLHPLASAIVFVLNSASNTRFLPVVIKSLVKALHLHVDRAKKSSIAWSLVGVQHYMKTVLAHSEEARELFVNQGGFDLICSEMFKNCQIENISWVDITCHSQILQEIHSSAILSLFKNALKKEKLLKDENGYILENFAPYAKIIGPPSSPGCDVLLGNKSPLRRTRFPAWGHQFQEGDDNWVALDIFFPFEIMLKEIVVYMHGNYLIGAPSSVIVDVSADSSYTSASPNLTTGGLQSIVLHFAESLICKKVRLRMRRPNGYDQLKLNMIELFGKSVFSVDDTGAVSMGSKKIAAEPWINVLSSLLTEQDSMMKYFLEAKHFDECLSCFVKSMPFLSSSCLQQVAGLLITKVVPIATTTETPSNASKITALILRHILRRGTLALCNSFQLNLMVKFLFDVIVASELSVQESIYCDLLDWIDEFLREAPLGDGLVVNCIQRVIQVFNDVPSKKVTLLNWKTKSSLMSQLRKLLTSDLLTTNKSLFVSFGQLLNTLESITPDGFRRLYLKAKESLETIKQSDVIDKNDEIAIQAVMFCCCSGNRSHCYGVLNDLAQHFSNLLSESKRNVDCIKNLIKLKSLLSIFCTAVCHDKNTILRSWYYTEIGQSFWEPLMVFLTSSDHELDENSLIMHGFLRQTIQLFKIILYLNPEAQESFCKILLKVLSESNSRTTFMSGYLKYLLHRLVISEETATVHFKPASSAYSLQQSCETQLYLSSTIGEITHTLLKYFNPLWSPSVSNKTAETAQIVTGSKAEKQPDSGPLSEYEYVFQIGNAAVSKRKPKSRLENKQQSSTAGKSKTVATPNTSFTVDFFLPVMSQAIPMTMKIGQILHVLYRSEELKDVLTLEYTISSSKSEISNYLVFNFLQEEPSMLSMLERFAAIGGLPLLTSCSDDSNANYIKLFSLILPLPGFASVFLKDRVRAELLLRLMLGVKETRAGQQIQSLVIAQDLSTLPLLALRNLLQQSSIQSEEGYGLRKLAFERGVVKFVLDNLKTLYYQTDEIKVHKPPSSYNAEPTSHQHPTTNNTDNAYWEKGTGFGTGSTVSSWDIDKAMKRKKKEEEDIVVIFQVLTAFIRKIPNSKVQVDDEAMKRLSSAFQEALSTPNVLEVLSGYLRNDSVLDMSRHIPLYHAVLAFIRPLAYTKSTIPLLARNKSEGNSIMELLVKLKNCVDVYNSRLKKTKLPGKHSSTAIAKPENPTIPTPGNSKIPTLGNTKIHTILWNFEGSCPVPTTPNQENGKVKKVAESKTEAELQNEADSEDLSLLLAYLNSTTDFVVLKVEEYKRELNLAKQMQQSSDDETSSDLSISPNGVQAAKNIIEETSAEELYVSEMHELQFDTYELIIEKSDGTLQFNVPYQYSTMVRAAAKSTDVINTARARRLAQEVASLSTSLPISYSSTVFLQCDEERLDVMKVLITGPEGTPYENGCFEFDVYFPPDYPTSPMCVNLATTGKHTVRFNPNLYNDGKVCLSILNTWHGRPEEKWNAQTSNLLQVLVSIQSLILVSDPYFNEPGYERLRGTPQGTESSSDYNAKIQQACVRWAIVEQIKRPSPCFKEIIHKHFLRKKDKVLAQCQNWISDLKELSTRRKSILHSYESLKSHFAELKLELAKLEKSDLEERVDDLTPKSDEKSDTMTCITEEISTNNVAVDTPETVNAISEPDVIVTSKDEVSENLPGGAGDVIGECISDESEEIVEVMDVL